MILGIGVDIVEIDKLRLAMIRRGERLRDRAFTPAEIEYCEGRANKFQHYSARFAAKEATSKALGTGIRGIRWREMEVIANQRGKPVLILHGSAAERAALLGLVHFDVSLTHSRTDAIAFVVGLKHTGATDANFRAMDCEEEVDSPERS